MSLLLQSFSFGLAVFFIFVGIAGVLIPIVPGTLLVWLTVVVYAIVERMNGFAAVDWVTFTAVTLIALVTGLAEFWLPLIGAKVHGSSRRAILFGVVGGIIGTFAFPLLGTIIGYAFGVLLGEYHKLRDWDRALRASLNAVASWGVATAIQLGGAILILFIFIWQVLVY